MNCTLLIINHFSLIANLKIIKELLKKSIKERI